MFQQIQLSVANVVKFHMGLQLSTQTYVSSFLIVEPLPGGGAEHTASTHIFFNAKRNSTQSYVSSFLIVEPFLRRREAEHTASTFFNVKRGLQLSMRSCFRLSGSNFVENSSAKLLKCMRV